MADAIVSAVADQLIAIIKEQIQNEIHLVRGVDKEVLQLSDELKRIRNVLDDAENRRFQDKNINHWLSRLEQTSYEMEDVLDEWNYAILKLQIERDDQSNDAVVASRKQKVCSFIPSSCLCFKKVAVRHDIAKKILNVKAQLDEILMEKDRYGFLMSQPTRDPSPKSWRDPSTSFIDLAGICGRDSDRDVLVTKLVASGGGQGELGILQVLSIVGVGGLGKTTLAQLVYNDSRVVKSFELRIWVCVSDPFDLTAIAKGIIEGVKKGDSPSTTNLETLLQRVRETISGKKILLVLDDVWTEDSKKWEPLKTSLNCGGAGSKILVTTRNRKVAKIMDTMDKDICCPGQLTNDDCWLLLSNVALPKSERNKEEFEKFEGIGKRIAEKCNGLPLAAKTLGSLLRFKYTLEEWENVLNSEIWKIEEAKLGLFPHLLLSYNELTPTLKRCFSYCAVFPKDSKIDVESLIGNWMALGYLGSNTGDMELKGRECFDVLAMRSLFQDFLYLDRKIKRCKMHDIVHDFAQFVRKSGRVEATGMNKTTCQVCDPLLVCKVNEFSSLFWDKGPPPSLCDCLTRMRVLSLSNCGLQSIPQGMRNLIHLRWLNLGRNTLSRDDLKIIFQLYNLQTLCLHGCSLEEIPREIGNLINLRLLDLSSNVYLKELPESICVLLELRILNLNLCDSLSGLPEGIHRLKNLKHIFNVCFYDDPIQLPQGLARLTGLCTLEVFHGGSGWNKLGLLKNLNRLSGSLELKIRLTVKDLEDIVEDAREAELRKKNHIKELTISFDDEMDEEEKSSRVRMGIMDALEPHPDLQKLCVSGYQGSKFPGWITSPVNRVRRVRLNSCNSMLSLPPLRQLPCLEEIVIHNMEGLEFVGREFLGLTTTIGGGGGGNISNAQSSSNTTVVAFPKLKKLTFQYCSKLKEWEDITAEEEESAAVSLMPCLTELVFQLCNRLTTLPHRLLHKASSLEKLDVTYSAQLTGRYGDKKGSARKSISQNHPHLKIHYV